MDETNNTSTSPQIFIGNPTLDEIKNYFMREKKLADIRYLERQMIPEGSPELSESFEIYLQEKKKKALSEKMKLAGEDKEEEEIELVKPEISVKLDSRQMQVDDTLADDSFLDLEKLCEDTLTNVSDRSVLNNVSDILNDLTTMEAGNASLVAPKGKNSFLKAICEEDQTFLHDVDAPSLMNFTLGTSPFKAPRENRPSTIMEVTELSVSTKSSVTSYRTAQTTLTNDKSECYQTAAEDSWMSRAADTKSYFNDSANYTKDSLNVTEKPAPSEFTRDSLADSKETFDISDDQNESLDLGGSMRMNDTLEAIERILAQGAANMKTPTTTALKQTPAKASVKTPNTTPKLTPARLRANEASPLPWSASKTAQMKCLSANGKTSPLIKFSPNTKSPASNFKLPKHPLSSSKTPQFSSLNKQKFLHIESPISRYINQTPDIPLSANAQTKIGIVGGGSRQYNFRDSEQFAKENVCANKGSSLPVRAKTPGTKQIFDVRNNMKKTPGGAKVKTLLANSSPSVVTHTKNVVSSSSKLFHDNTLISETSMLDTSYAHAKPEDVSFLVVEEIKRFK